MLTLYLVRHGQTTFNTRGLMQGWCDSPLTAEGVVEVRRTAEQLKDRRFVAAYSSTSERAMDTAALITERHPGLATVTDKDLRELSFGELEATPVEEAWHDVHPVRFFTELLTGVSPGLPGGEGSAEYLPRVRRAFARIVDAHEDGEVLVVSHGVTLMAYLRLLGIEPSGFLPLANASVSVVEIGEDGSIEVPVVGALDLPRASSSV